MATTVTRQQYFQAIAQSADLSTLFNAVPADPNDVLWIEFNSALSVSMGDQLSMLAQSVYGWSDLEVVEVFKKAQLIPNICCGD